MENGLKRVSDCRGLARLKTGRPGSDDPDLSNAFCGSFRAEIGSRCKP